MNIDRERNYYSYRGFEHLVRNFRNIGRERRLEYENERDNLNREQNLVVLNQVLVIIIYWNKFTMFGRIMDNIFCYNRDMLREVIVKIRLKRIDTQKEIMVEVLDSRAMGLVISLEFARKQGFKLKKIERVIYVRNIDSLFKKERLIKYMVEVSIYY